MNYFKCVILLLVTLCLLDFVYLSLSDSMPGFIHAYGLMAKVAKYIAVHIDPARDNKADILKGIQTDGVKMIDPWGNLLDLELHPALHAKDAIIIHVVSAGPDCRFKTNDDIAWRWYLVVTPESRKLYALGKGSNGGRQQPVDGETPMFELKSEPTSQP